MVAEGVFLILLFKSPAGLEGRAALAYTHRRVSIVSLTLIRKGYTHTHTHTHTYSGHMQPPR